MSRDYIDENSTKTTHERQLEADAVANYQEEQNAEELDLIAGETTDELSSLLHDMSYYAEFNGKLDRINGELSANDMEFGMNGEFEDELELVDLERMKERADRVYNDSVGTRVEPLATAFRDTVASVTLGYEEVIL